MDGISKGTHNSTMTLFDLKTGIILGSSSTWNMPERDKSKIINRIDQVVVKSSKNSLTTIMIIPTDPSSAGSFEQSVMARLEADLVQRNPQAYTIFARRNVPDMIHLLGSYDLEMFDTQYFSTVGSWKPVDIMITVEVLRQTDHPQAQIHLIDLHKATLLDSMAWDLPSPEEPEPSDNMHRSLSTSNGLNKSSWTVFGGVNYISTLSEFRFFEIGTRFTLQVLSNMRFGIDFGGALSESTEQAKYFFGSLMVSGQIPIRHAHSNFMVLFASAGGRYAYGEIVKNDRSTALSHPGILFDIGMLTRWLEVRISTNLLQERIDLETTLGFNVLGFFY